MEMVEIFDTLPRKSLDELFKWYYLETASKAEAYRRACKAGGHEFIDKYAGQYGKAMYDRLAKDISKAIDQAETEDEALGRMVQREIAKDRGETTANRLTAANYLRKKKTDRIEIIKPDDITDIDAELDLIERELNSKAIDSECIDVTEIDKDS